ncbi:MAG: VCBS repeat-containing protein, partial [Acidobacteriota bacterium]
GSPVAVGEGSGRLVLGDVNGDGYLDLVTCHLQQRLVRVVIGDGTGRFTPGPGSPITLGYTPGDVKLGDVNSDGILDLAVTSSERDAVEILLGNGTGAFKLAPGSPFTASASLEFYTHRLELVDVNEDGKLDIITANQRRNTFSTLLGNGRGEFSPGPATTFPPGQLRYFFALGDIDGDGHLDVVTASGQGPDSSEPGRVAVLRGNGKGVFKELSEASHSVPPEPRLILLADMNGDQRQDMVIGHSNNRVSVLLNVTSGQFASAPGSPYNLGAGDEAFGLAVADFNRDKRNDLAAASVDTVTVLLRDKDGFAPGPGSPFRAGPGAYHLVLGDINKDGKLDVVASSFDGNAVTVLLGR